MIDNSFNLGTDFINIVTSDTVTMKESFSLSTQDGVHVLEVKISANFENIPSKYHEVFLNMMTSKYLNKVSFSDNPFSECKKEERKKWWKFWSKK